MDGYDSLSSCLWLPPDSFKSSSFVSHRKKEMIFSYLCHLPWWGALFFKISFGSLTKDLFEYKALGSQNMKQIMMMKSIHDFSSFLLLIIPIVMLDYKKESRGVRMRMMMTIMDEGGKRGKQIIWCPFFFSYLSLPLSLSFLILFIIKNRAKLPYIMIKCSCDVLMLLFFMWDHV